MDAQLTIVLGLGVGKRLWFLADLVSLGFLLYGLARKYGKDGVIICECIGIAAIFGSLLLCGIFGLSPWIFFVGVCVGVGCVILTIYYGLSTWMRARKASTPHR